MGVFRREHEPTGIEYNDNLYEIDKELRRVTGSEKIFPKRYRLTDVLPLRQLWHEVVQNVGKADSRFPTNEKNLAKRKEYIQLAIEANEALIRELQLCIYNIDSVTPDKLEQLGILLQKESKLLRGYKKNAKIQKEK